jgi:hypothetical protein
MLYVSVTLYKRTVFVKTVYFLKKEKNCCFFFISLRKAAFILLLKQEPNATSTSPLALSSNLQRRETGILVDVGQYSFSLLPFELVLSFWGVLFTNLAKLYWLF